MVAVIARCLTCRQNDSRQRRTRKEGPMTSSPEIKDKSSARKAPDDLPPALSSMWRLCKLGYQHEPLLMLVAFVLSQVAVLPDALLALWLKLLGQGVLGNQPGLVR